MLITKGVSVDEVVTVRTTAGEEIIGKLVEIGAEYVVLNRPRALVPTQKGVDFVPFMFTTSSDNVPLSKQALLTAPLASDKEAADLYIQKTTGIALG
jgi:hypothetical protein